MSKIANPNPLTVKLAIIFILAFIVAVSIVIADRSNEGITVPTQCYPHECGGIPTPLATVIQRFQDDRERFNEFAAEMDRKVEATRESESRDRYWDPNNQSNTNQQIGRVPDITDTRLRHRLTDPVGDSSDFTNYENELER